MILHRPVSAGLLLFSSSLLSSGALARTAGIDSLTCRGCHGANENAELNVQFDPEQPEPGQETLLTITVAAAELQTAGLAIQGPEVGSFSIPAGEPLTTTGRWVVHTQLPRTGRLPGLLACTKLSRRQPIQCRGARRKRKWWVNG